MTRAAALVAASLTALAAGCGASDQHVAVIAPAPTTTAIAAPQPPRSYRDLGAPVAIDQRLDGVPPASFSPDVALAAVALGDPAGLGLFDIDRRAMVGRAALPARRAHLVEHRFAPQGDLFAVVSRAPLEQAWATVRYDGRTGALRDVAEGELRGFVVVHGEARYVVVDEAAGKIELRAFITPEPPPMAIALPKGAERVVVAANGVLVVGMQASVRALDAGGRELWSRPTPLGYVHAASAEASALLEQIDGGIDGGRVRVTDLWTGKERQTITGARVYAASGGAPTTSDPEAAPFITSNADGRFAIIDVGPRPRPPIVLGPPPRAFGVAPGARFAAWVTPSGDVSLGDVARGSFRAVGNVDVAAITQVVLSGDGALVGVVAREPGHAPMTRLLQDGREEITLPGACALVSDATGAARVATCEGRWFDLSRPTAPTSIAPSEPSPARDVVFDDGAVVGFTARCGAAGATAALGVPGPRGQASTKGSLAWKTVGASGLAVHAAGVDVWNFASAQLRGQVSTRAGEHGLYALSADATLLAVAGTNDLAVEIFRVADGKRLHTIRVPAAIATIGFHGNRELLVATAKQALGCCWNENPMPRPTYADGGKITVFDATSGRALRAYAGEGFVLDATGSTIGVTAPERAAVLDVTTGKTITSLPDRGRLTQLSPSGHFAVLQETRGEMGERVTMRVVELPSGRERLAVRDASAVAFAPDEARVALTLVVPGELFAQALTTYDLARDRREDIALADPGARPFFARGGAVLGYETAGGLGFVRLADGRALHVRGFERRGACRLYAATADGAFTGDAEGGLGIRLGDDLGVSELLVSGTRFEAHRRDDLLAWFFGGP